MLYGSRVAIADGVRRDEVKATEHVTDHLKGGVHAAADHSVYKLQKMRGMNRVTATLGFIATEVLPIKVTPMNALDMDCGYTVHVPWFMSH